MKALKLYEPGNLVFEDTVPEPAIKPDEVLVRVRACGLCGSDIPRILTYGAYHPKLIPGHEFSGEIVTLGAGVTDWHVGERVCAAPLIPCFTCPMCLENRFSLCGSYDYLGSRSDGALATFVRVPRRNLIRLPEGVPFEAGAMLDPAANAAHAWTKADVTHARRVAVLGLGAIGLFAVQMAKLAGAPTVAAVDVSPEKLALGKLAGADILVDAREGSPSEALREATGGLGFDVVLESSGVPVAQEEAILSTGNGGVAVFLGITHKPLTLAGKTVDAILRREIAVKGSWNSFSGPFPGAEWTETVKLFGSGKLWRPEFISHCLRLEDGPAFFERLKNDNTLFYSKVMFFPD